MIRVLHVVVGMDRGGIETWLMHMYRNLDRSRYQFDFQVRTFTPCAFDDEIRSLGGKILPLRHPDPRYPRWFLRVLAEHGPYDVVHSHAAHFSAIPLGLAMRAGVRTRIAHSHATQLMGERPSRVRRALSGVATRVLRRVATHRLAGNAEAAAALYGPRWQSDPGAHIIHTGIDMEQFAAPVDRAAVRAQLGIPASSFTMGNVGRFWAQKNHRFLIAIAAEVAKREPDMRLVLLGEGPLEGEIRAQIAELGLGDRVIFTDIRPRPLLAAIDVFVLPSLYEGLPLVGIEAQAAGVPLVMSDVITRELDVVQPLLRRLSLDQSPAEWAEAVLAARGGRAAVPDALAQMRRSSFDLSYSLRQLQSYYDA